MEEEGKSSILSSLEFLDFRYIWLSQVFSQIALNILTFALILHIFELSGRATSVSLVMLSSAVAVAIFGPVSGVLADRIDYRKILLFTNVLRSISALLLIFANGNMLAYLEIFFIISALSQIFTPAESSSIPLVVPKDRLISANSIVMATTYITLIFGYAIAGPLLNFMGADWLFFLCVVLYLISALTTNRLSNYDNKESKKITIENLARGIGRVWDDLIFSIDYLKSNKKVLDPMLKLTIGWTVLGAFITLLPAYAENVLELNAKMVGPLIIGPAGAGMIFGAVFLNHKKNANYRNVIKYGFFIVSSSLFFFSTYYLYKGMIVAPIMALVFLIIMGAGSSMVQVAAQTMLHINSEEDQRGRVFGLSSMQLRLATSIPALLVAGIADITSPLVTMLLLSVSIFFYSVFLLFDKKVYHIFGGINEKASIYTD